MPKYWSKMAKRAKPYVPGEQVNQENILKLNTNENPYPPSPKVLEAIRERSNETLRRYPSPVLSDLRQAIARYNGLEEKNVFVGNGSDEVLAFSFMAFFNPGETIKFPEISYSFYPVYATLFDIPYQTTAMAEDFSIQVEALFESEGGVIFPNPNAPTSLYLPLDKIETVLKNNPNKVVIVDEAYVDFAPTSAVELIDKYDNLLVIQTMSKSRQLAGLRVGFAMGHEDLIAAIIRMKDSFNSYSVDRLAMQGALAAIDDDAYFKKTRDQIKRTREWVMAELKVLGFKVLDSEANFVFTSHPKIEAGELYKTLRQKDVLVRYFAQAPIDQYLRISIGTDEEMKQFMNVLEKIIH